MDSDELAAIRAKRMAEMQGGMGGMSAEQTAAQAEQKAAEEDKRQSILSTVLSPDARLRIHTISLVKPDKARRVEDMIIRNAQMGRIGGRVSEKDVVSLLEQLSEKTEKATKVKIQRRHRPFDSDEEEESDDDY